MVPGPQQGGSGARTPHCGNTAWLMSPGPRPEQLCGVSLAWGSGSVGWSAVVTASQLTSPSAQSCFLPSISCRLISASESAPWSLSCSGAFQTSQDSQWHLAGVLCVEGVCPVPGTRDRCSQPSRDADRPTKDCRTRRPGLRDVCTNAMEHTGWRPSPCWGQVTHGKCVQAMGHH